MPQNPCLIASKTISGEVHIFDYTKHPSKPVADSLTGSKASPNLRLTGHTKEGYGLAWSPLKKGNLLSGSEDEIICHWDIQASYNSNNNNASSIKPLNVFRGHGGIVEDVAWHYSQENVFASVGDDFRLILWDLRSASESKLIVNRAHEEEINSVAFCPANAYLLATASSDRTVALWDSRNMSLKLHSLTSHSDEVFQVNLQILSIDVPIDIPIHHLYTYHLYKFSL